MPDEHRPVVPVGLEQVIAALAELGAVLGDDARGALPGIQARLAQALAARERGDPVAALRLIGEAMAELAVLADRLDPAEAGLMRALSEHFGAALLRGDLPEAKQDLDVMFARSGARERRRK